MPAINRPDGGMPLPGRPVATPSGSLTAPGPDADARPGASMAADEGPAGSSRSSSLALGQAGPPPGRWQPGQPLSEAHNAHSTNTVEDFEAALASGANWFEGDVRVELNPPHAHEMRHDKGAEPGDNLTLVEWLARGKAAGVGLKLDIKEGQRMEEILDTVAASGVPDHRLMFNLGDGEMARWGAPIRARFPGATLAVNPTDALGGKKNEGPLADWQVDRMIALAEAAGPPVTFVVRYDRLTDAAIARLAAHGTISVWNDPGQGGVTDVKALEAALRRRGVDGVIDLRPSLSLPEKALEGLKWLHQQQWNLLGAGWQKAGSLLGAARDRLKSWF